MEKSVHAGSAPEVLLLLHATAFQVYRTAGVGSGQQPHRKLNFRVGRHPLSPPIAMLTFGWSGNQVLKKKVADIITNFALGGRGKIPAGG